MTIIAGTQRTISPLNPRAIPAAPRVWAPTFDLDPEAKRFGFFPDIDALLPGDLILTRSIEPGLTDVLIAAGQSGRALAADWTHAAMFTGAHDRIVESSFDGLFTRNNGVRIGHLTDYISDNEILVRRLHNHFVHSEDPADATACLVARWRIVVSAMMHLRRPYGFFRLLGFLGRRRHIKRRMKNTDLVCSTLYAAAVADAVSRLLGTGTPSPGELAESRDFDTIQIDWVQIGPRPL